ncbi:Arginine methyltransferase 10 isoform 1 [Hibiscus syriacus]|uniref:Arginine methyltransferase 10 isoform 1 n=1 Tax=Hibiscus syriacus TaxID=106335 RepID=A0A6A3A241_HIBSY|nr:Arginine methyltransferase 10 isoform 1 [Hibiscus syriacus]KAE8698370.1 Arginine methyltransferase 10 isoform 1 [Hibiscus syriacus]
MHRSSSSSSNNRLISDEFFINLPPPTMASSQLLKVATALNDHLPEYGGPIAGANKKEMAYHHHSAKGERVINLIPVVLFCIILPNIL